MKNNQPELKFEYQWLDKTISFVKKQLKQAKQGNEKNKAAILSAKQELRENAAHSISGLWTNDGFETLAAFSQYVNPVTDKIADYEATENKIRILENLMKSPYFARINFKFADEDYFEKVYIGRSALLDEDSFEMVVHDWRSPIASIFYRFVTGPAFYDAPEGRITGEVNLKRQYEIKNGLLEYFFDADVQIADEFLRKLLSQNTSAKMKAVVETIQREQDIVIRDIESGLMMVQGVAGSGKTSIALHRVAYLMYHGLSAQLSANNIMIISPNTLFEQYVSNVLPELGEDNVVSMLFEEIMATVLKKEQIQSKNKFLENLITGRHYHDTTKKSMEFKTSQQFIEILNRFIADLPDRWIAFEDVYTDGICMIDKEVLKNKIISGRQTTPLGLRLKQLEDFILEFIQEQITEPFLHSAEALLKNEIKNFIELDVVYLYKCLFQDKEYFYNLAEGMELPNNIEAIFLFTQENLQTSLLYYDDAVALTFLHLKINGSQDYKNIKQVVIDEAQDYYPMQYEIFHLLFSNAKYTILGDINQTLEKKEDLTLYEQIGKILKKKKTTFVTMDKSFRCTNEILQFSSQFLEQSITVKSFNRNGEAPGIYAFPDQETLLAGILSEVQLCLEKGYQSIGLICKTEKDADNLFECLKNHLDIQLVKDGSSANLQGVFLIPVYMSKGLEFDAVLVCGADSRNYATQEDKKLLYIACTRALHRLNMFYMGEASPLL